MPRALLSVSDKTGLLDFARELAALGWDLVASGGTRKSLEDAGLSVVAIERLTGAPEMLGGRVKTLHPAIHAGILSRDTESDLDELREQGFAPIELVVCNLYPFSATVSAAGATLEDAIEHIDIGGVTLLRGAAKNFSRVAVACDPSDYPLILDDLREFGRVSSELRRKLAIKAFAQTRDYDTAIHAYLVGESAALDELSDSFSLNLVRAADLRYGENPHQKAGFFAASPADNPLGAEQLAGKPLSYNNILDADAAWRAAASFKPEQEAAVVIVKHLTPCGVAVGVSPEATFPFALESDPISAFGGVIAVNRPINKAFVDALGTLFLEAIIAPDFDDEAAQQLIEGRKNCRLLRIKNGFDVPSLELRSVLGGVLAQQRDNGDPIGTEWKIVSKRPPTAAESDALRFAWQVVGHVKSNAIVLAHQGATVGIGGGLTSRVDAVKLAVERAGNHSRGSVMASDAFFPFPDGVEVAADAGITAVIQPGGSLQDKKVIEAADAADIAMVFTGVRHFRH